MAYDAELLGGVSRELANAVIDFHRRRFELLGVRGGKTEVGTAHAGFMSGVCTPGGTARCDCPGWGSVESIIVNHHFNPCLTMMWHEVDNPAGEQGHYEAMSNSQYMRVACGVNTTPDGEVWAVQDYSR